MTEFTHLDGAGQPAMVDVSEKPASRRTAKARAVVILPPDVLQHLQSGEINTPKGAVFQTAILAGIMASKQTSALIPLCHPLGLDICTVNISVNNRDEVVVYCTAGNTGKTGVEMEALTGASVAALTIYDMCKAFSHHIVIREIRLLEKTGGKKDYFFEEAV